MNALFELLGKRFTKNTFDCIVRRGTDFDDYTIETKKDSFGIETVSVCPKWEATATKEWFKRIKFAKIDCDETHLILPSKRTEEDELAFYKGLAFINYYEGGGQELYGIIAFNDGTWLDRGEYDGSEWWQKHSFPREEDYINGEQD